MAFINYNVNLPYSTYCNFNTAVMSRHIAVIIINKYYNN